MKEAPMNPQNSTDPSLAASAGQATAPKHRNVAVILAGGVGTRETSYAALSWIGDGESNVIFHDPVRPLVDSEIVTANLRRGQTPPAFRLPVIHAAYELARKDPAFTATDDCSVVLKYLPEVPIFVVQGDEANVKITHPIDIHIADKLFQLKESRRLNLRAAELLDIVFTELGCGGRAEERGAGGGEA
jgi:2-C-methyl-D-erythritol 4-phosphate cytidylyltransferase